MTIKSRLQKLEAKRGGGMPEVMVCYFDNGRVSACEKYPDLIGKTEADIDALYNGRDDVLCVKVVYVSKSIQTTGE